MIFHGDIMSKIIITGSDAKNVAIAIKHFLKRRISQTHFQSKTDILILTSNVHPPFPSCDILLIPDGLTIIPITKTAISYGMSPKCSITLSSLGKKPVLSVQREIITLKGRIIEPQDIPIQNSLNLSQYALMASSAALLILGIPPERLS